MLEVFLCPMLPKYSILLRIFALKSTEMKRIIYLFAIALIAASCGTSKDASGSGDSPKLGKAYGPTAVQPELSVPVSEMVERSKTDGSEMEYTFEGEIIEVCSKAGCWVNIDNGEGGTFMVRFKDHFTIPVDTKPGTKAYFHGVASNETISVEMLQHFAEDAGKSEEEIKAITQPQSKLGFIADGIVLKK